MGLNMGSAVVERATRAVCVEFFRAAKDALCFACFSIAEIDCEAVAAAVHAEAVRGGVAGTNIEDAPVILIKHFENDAERLQVVREAMLHDVVMSLLWDCQADQLRKIIAALLALNEKPAHSWMAEEDTAVLTTLERMLHANARCQASPGSVKSQDLIDIRTATKAPDKFMRQCVNSTHGAKAVATLDAHILIAKKELFVMSQVEAVGKKLSSGEASQLKQAKDLAETVKYFGKLMQELQGATANAAHGFVDRQESVIKPILAGFEDVLKSIGSVLVTEFDTRLCTIVRELMAANAKNNKAKDLAWFEQHIADVKIYTSDKAGSTG